MRDQGLVFLISKEKRQCSFSLSPEAYDKLLEKLKAMSVETKENRSKCFEQLFEKVLNDV